MDTGGIHSGNNPRMTISAARADKAMQPVHSAPLVAGDERYGRTILADPHCDHYKAKPFCD